MNIYYKIRKSTIPTNNENSLFQHVEGITLRKDDHLHDANRNNDADDEE